MYSQNCYVSRLPMFVYIATKYHDYVKINFEDAKAKQSLKESVTSLSKFFAKYFERRKGVLMNEQRLQIRNKKIICELVDKIQ